MHLERKGLRMAFVILFFVLSATVKAQCFESQFADSTLRADFIFVGDCDKADVYLDGYNKSKGWYGRRSNLGRLPLLGNGQVWMLDKATGDTIYANSFTSLFLEWIATPESHTVGRAYEHPILLPMPRREATIVVQLVDEYQKAICTRSFPLNPADILIRELNAEPLPHHYIGKQSDAMKAIDIAFLPEGYTQEQMVLFHDDCVAAMKAIMEHRPFSEYADRFNFVVVEAPSKEAGNSVPREHVWKNSVCGSSFDTFYTERYNTTRHLRQVHELLTGIPYEHIIILTNSTTYGGGGFYNDYCIASSHAQWTTEVIVHEFGHSFGGLGDEYATESGCDNFYPDDVEPWEQNITTLKDFRSKWADMVDKGTPVPTPGTKDEKTRYSKVGVYEGAGYQTKGVYRPVEDCRMRINNVKDFCPVCQRALTRMIKFYTE